MKQLKLLITILSIFAIGLIIVLVVLYNINQEQNNNTTVETTQQNIQENVIVNEIENTNVEYNSSEAPILTYNTSVRQITDNTTLYELSKSINNYFQYIKDNNMQAVVELGGNDKYVIQNNVKYSIRQAFVTENEYVRKYYTRGILTIANGDYTATEQEIYQILYLDYTTNSYKIENTTKEKVMYLTELGQEENVAITEGVYNQFQYEYVDDVKQMEIYLEDFVFEVFNNTEKSYYMLDEEYRNKRFGGLEAYYKFLNEKQEQLKDIQILQYNIYREADYTLYKGTDNNGNYYWIRDNSYMDYKLMLDNYTLDDYSNSNEQEKIEKSTQKFILMINSADYLNAYNLLTESFKNTYFPTEQDFISYIKANWFSRNIIASMEILEDGSCDVMMQQTLSIESNKLQKNFKVTMGEGMNFTIEFDV